MVAVVVEKTMGAENGMLLDVTRLAGRMIGKRTLTGIDRVGLAYIEKYGRRSCAALRCGPRHLFFSRASSRIIFDKLLKKEKISHAWLAFLYMKDAATLSLPRTQGAVLLNVSHSGLDKPGYISWLRARGIRPIVMVHDLIPITHPEYTVPGERHRHILRIGSALQSCAIIANSQVTLAELRAYAANKNAPMPVARAAPLGTTSLAAPAAVPQMESPYFVLLGTIEPRKNHLLILNVWRMLAERMGKDTPRLVLIGHRGWECENALDMIERCEKLAGHVIEMPHCADAGLAACLKGASALLFPSFTEGYGLPLCEALSLGVPVIAADLPVFRETAHDIPEYISPIDGMKWAEAIADYARPDSPRALAQKKRMEGFAPPTWGSHFEIVDDLLQSLEKSHG